MSENEMQNLTPTEAKVYDAICEILTGDFEIPAEKLRWDGLLYEDYDIDSIDAVDMIVQMRPHLNGKHLNGKRLAPEDFKSVKTLGDVVRVIARVLDEPAA